MADLISGDFSPKAGLLADFQIEKAINEGFLFSKDTCDVSKIKHATYEIRVSEDYHELSYANGAPVFAPKKVNQGGAIIIEPGHTIKVLAKEVFKVPLNVYAKINTVGQIFSAGLAAENTYADPGFNGQIYITLSNISARRLSIKPNDPLARVEFHKLEQPVHKPHSGQTGIRKSFINVETDGDIRNLLNNKSTKELIEEMVAQSLDDALHKKNIRSEVLISKAHEEIGLLKEGIKSTRYLSVFLFFILAIIMAFKFNIGSLFSSENVSATIFNIFCSIVASIIFAFAQKRLF